jgi:YgiT-type zinc finger domain-containing protein
MKHTYDDCFFCGGEVEERLLPREIRWKGELLVFEDVPMGVCIQCGEKFLHPEVAKKIDDAILSPKRPSRVLQVPVYQF